MDRNLVAPERLDHLEAGPAVVPDEPSRNGFALLVSSALSAFACSP
jgi:hypothetical protein